MDQRVGAKATCASIVFAATLAPSGVAHADPPFIPGSASAIAQTLQIAPRTGGLAATITVGRSIADYRGSLAQASSQTTDLGVIGSTLTVQCDASPPTLKPSQLPKPLIAESDHGTSRSSKNTAGTAKSGVLAVAGRESVLATTVPRSTASFVGQKFVVPGVLSMSGLQSTSRARLIKGKARIASAGADVGQVSLLGGVVKLSGLHWRATDRTGTSRRSRGNFTMDGATIAGQHLPVTPAAIASTIDKINKALAVTGLHLTLPSKTRAHGKLTVTPLTIGIDSSKLGAESVNPVLGALTPVTNPLTTLLVGVSCKIGSLLTVADLLLSGIDGTGGLDVDLGGAVAISDGTSYGDPFGNSPPSGRSPGGSSGPKRTPGSNPSQGGGTTSSGGTTPTSTVTSASGPPAQVNGATTVSASCSTISPAGRPSCSSGAGLKVGLIALAVVLAFAGADFIAMRRRRT